MDFGNLNSVSNVAMVGQESYLSLFGQITSTILVAGFAIIGSLWTYHKKSEFELIKERYLIGAIDRASNDLAVELNIFWQNWSRFLFLVKKCRDAPNFVEVKELYSGFARGNVARFNQDAYFRIFWLVKTDLFWKLNQLALAFLDDANKKLCYEMPEVLHAKLENRINLSWEEVLGECLKKAKEFEGEGHKYAEVTRGLQVLGFEIERKPLRYRRLEKYLETFHKRNDVRRELERLEKKFAEELNAAAM